MKLFKFAEAFEGIHTRVRAEGLKEGGHFQQTLKFSIAIISFIFVVKHRSEKCFETFSIEKSWEMFFYTSQ